MLFRHVAVYYADARQIRDTRDTSLIFTVAAYFATLKMMLMLRAAARYHAFYFHAGFIFFFFFFAAPLFVAAFFRDADVTPPARRFISHSRRYCHQLIIHTRRHFRRCSTHNMPFFRRYIIAIVYHRYRTTYTLPAIHATRFAMIFRVTPDMVDYRFSDERCLIFDELPLTLFSPPSRFTPPLFLTID